MGAGAHSVTCWAMQHMRCVEGKQIDMECMWLGLSIADLHPLAREVIAVDALWQ